MPLTSFSGSHRVADPSPAPARVMLAEDLATLYEVEVRALNQAVARNAERFPTDFMFQLTGEEVANFEVTICDLKLREGHGRLEITICDFKF